MIDRLGVVIAALGWLTLAGSIVVGTLARITAPSYVSPYAANGHLISTVLIGIMAWAALGAIGWIVSGRTPWNLK
jgi:hypothetical protein